MNQVLVFEKQFTVVFESMLKKGISKLTPVFKPVTVAYPFLIKYHDEGEPMTKVLSFIYVN